MPNHRLTTYNLSLHSLILAITLSILFHLADSRTHPEDLKVLKDLRKRVNQRSIPPGSCLSSWDSSKDPCDHVFSSRFTCGLRCDRVVSGWLRVTEITLDQVGYNGSLSSTNWNLPYLQILDISGNSFTGSIPDSLSNLTRLHQLSLSKNLLTGEIPDSLGSLSHLEELYLDSNQFQGHIPRSLNKLIRLKRFEIQQNNISGEFPSLNSLQNLNYLDASENQITSLVPPLPKSLIELLIRNNSLQGSLLSDGSLNELTQLQVLDLSRNKLSGAISSSVFEHQSLQQLTLAHNDFTFLLHPRNLGVNSYLVALDLSYNALRGLLPGFFANMPRLSALSLEHNFFTGMIPSQYALKAVFPGANTAPFERLLLGGNYLFGPIPDPLLGLKPGSANVSLVDNCLYRCPDRFFFCQGGNQKSLIDCKIFGRIFP